MTTRYRRVPPSTWDKAWFRALSRPQPNGQTLWLYFIAGPQTTAIPGLFSAGEASMAEALGWPLAKFRKAFRELEAQELAHADWAARMVWLPSVFSLYPPESPNVLRAWRDAFDELPDCELTAQTRAAVEDLVKDLSEPFRKGWAEGSRKTLAETSRNKEKEKEILPGQGEGASPLPPFKASPGRPPSRKHVNQAWGV